MSWITVNFLESCHEGSSRSRVSGSLTETSFGGLKENGPKGSGTIKMCSLVAVGAVLEEVCHCGGGL